MVRLDEVRDGAGRDGDREASAVGAAAARAASERARRRRRPTPLVGVRPAAVPGVVPAPEPAPVHAGGDTAGAQGSGPADHASPRDDDSGQEDLARLVDLVSGLLPGVPGLVTKAWSSVTGAPSAAAVDAARLLAGLAGQAERVLADVVGATGLPDAAELAGRAGSALLDAVEATRRRMGGDYEVDEFGFDADWTDEVLLPLLRPLYRRWFRVEVRGLEHLPVDGPALLVANHSGGVALDSLMLAVAVHDEHPAGRHLRMLGADLLFRTPVLGEVARRGGVTLASMDDALRLLRAGHLVGVWPEGFKGTGKPFSERYKLQRFGRGGFVAAALRTGTPIVPVAIVGAEETYPVIGDMPALARLFGLPYAPVTPTWPWLGPLGLVPLPSKWTIQFCPPMPTDGYGPASAEDSLTVFDLADQVRHTIQQTLYELLVRRRSVFL